MAKNPDSLVGSDPSVIALFLQSFFSEMNKEKLLWAVMRGWEGLPFYTRHDVDFLVDRKNLSAALKILRSVAAQTGWIEYGSFRFSNLTSIWFLLDDSHEVSFLQLDFFTEASLRGVRFLDSSKWLHSRIAREDGLYHMDIGYAACCTLIKECLANGRLDGELRYQQVRDAVALSSDAYRKALKEILGDSELFEKVFDLSRREDWKGLENCVSEMRRYVFRFKASNIFPIFRYVCDVFRLQFFPYLRIFIAIIGPDGCGKTTVADGVSARFKHRPFASIRRIHSDFGFLPRLRDIKKWIFRLANIHIDFASDLAPGTRHMGMQPPLSQVRSMLYVLYYGIGLRLGMLKLLTWRTFSGMILADRYYYDYYYMRGHMQCPRWWLDMIGIIVPEPDLIFYLDRPAEKIYAQKPELEISEIKRQQQAINDVMKKNKRFRIINASQGIDDAVQKVSRWVELWLISRKQSG